MEWGGTRLAGRTDRAAAAERGDAGWPCPAGTVSVRGHRAGGGENPSGFLVTYGIARELSAVAPDAWRVAGVVTPILRANIGSAAVGD